MEEKQTCRRCSVSRVNILCTLYQAAYGENVPEALKALKGYAQLAGLRGYQEAMTVLQPGMVEDAVRKICWNISSLLYDDDFKRIGMDGHGRGNPGC